MKTLLKLFFTVGVLSTANMNAQNVIKLEDFGAVFTDSNDDTQAFKDALEYAKDMVIYGESFDGIQDSIEVAGPVIELSTGTLNLSGNILIPDIFLTIIGKGMDSTKLKWNSPGGLKNLVTDTIPPYGNIEIRDLSITAATPNAGIGLKAEGVNSALVTMIMTRVRFDGESGGFWNTCFFGEFLPLSQINNCEFYGNYTGTDNLVKITDFSVASRFLENKLQNAQIGFSFIGKMEGIFLVDNEISNVRTGIVRKLDSNTLISSEPLFDIIDNYISAGKNCLDIRGISASNISGNTLIIDDSLNDSSFNGIWINGTNIERSLTIDNNIIVKEGNPKDGIAISINNLEQALSISDNRLVNFKTGVKLDSVSNILFGDNILTNIDPINSELTDFNSLTDLFVLSEPGVSTIQCFEESSCQVAIEKITASGYRDLESLPDNVLDCDPISRWTEFGIDSYIQFELKDSVLVSSVEISFNGGNQRTADFEILLSNDGNNFNSKGDFTSSGLTSDYENFSFTQESAKFVKIIAKGNSDNNWNSYKGVRIYADGQNSSCSSSTNLMARIPIVTEDIDKFDNSNTIIISPNPIIESELNLNYISKERKVYWVEIHDITGHSVYLKKHFFHLGSNKLNLNLGFIRKGLHVITIGNDGKKFIVE